MDNPLSITPEQLAEWSEDDHDDLADWPTAPKTIEAIRAIVDNHSCKMIDGVLVDAQSARAIVLVYDALSDKNREQLMSWSMARIGTTAWKLVR